ncbi:hypothetical protein B0H14DRAFT_2588096 [Mycena olivaceomarginata]|nr:hypothetical protein B0H14DRAFT_2588096 [Mycena olivaceomarginata]
MSSTAATGFSVYDADENNRTPSGGMLQPRKRAHARHSPPVPAVPFAEGPITSQTLPRRDRLYTIHEPRAWWDNPPRRTRSLSLLTRPKLQGVLTMHTVCTLIDAADVDSRGGLSIMALQSSTPCASTARLVYQHGTAPGGDEGQSLTSRSAGIARTQSSSISEHARRRAQTGAWCTMADEDSTDTSLSSVECPPYGHRSRLSPHTTFSTPHPPALDLALQRRLTTISAPIAPPSPHSDVSLRTSANTPARTGVACLRTLPDLSPTAMEATMSTSAGTIRTIQARLSPTHSPFQSPPDSPSLSASGSSVSSFPSASSSFFNSAAASPPHEPVPHPVEETLIIPSLTLPALIRANQLQGPVTRLLVLGPPDVATAALFVDNPDALDPNAWVYEDGFRVLRMSTEWREHTDNDSNDNDSNSERWNIELVALGEDVHQLDIAAIEDRILAPFRSVVALLAPPLLSSAHEELLTALLMDHDVPLYTALLVVSPSLPASTHPSSSNASLSASNCVTLDSALPSIAPPNSSSNVSISDSAPDPPAPTPEVDIPETLRRLVPVIVLVPNPEPTPSAAHHRRDRSRSRALRALVARGGRRPVRGHGRGRFPPSPSTRAPPTTRCLRAGVPPPPRRPLRRPEKAPLPLVMRLTEKGPGQPYAHADPLHLPSLLALVRDVVRAWAGGGRVGYGRRRYGWGWKERWWESDSESERVAEGVGVRGGGAGRGGGGGGGIVRPGKGSVVRRRSGVCLARAPLHRSTAVLPVACRFPYAPSTSPLLHLRAHTGRHRRLVFLAVLGPGLDPRGFGWSQEEAEGRIDAMWCGGACGGRGGLEVSGPVDVGCGRHGR